jgi:lipid A 3-O-deacylase PagL
MAMARVGTESFKHERHERAVSRKAVASFALALCFAAETAYGQDGPDGGPWFTRVGFTPAYVVSTNPFSLNAPGGKPINSTPSMTIEVGRQTDGSSEWHQLYGLPSYGFGVSVASLGNGDGISRPVEAYTFFSWPFAQLSERVQVTTDFGMGVSWNWKAFNHQTNSYTAVLGSDLNARIDWGFYLRFIATPQTSLYAGIDYTHRSNGGTQQPDLGINVIGPSVALRYNLAPPRHSLPSRPRPPFQPAWEFVIGGAGGLKNVVDGSHPDRQRDFGAFGVTTGLQRQFYRYGKIATGSEITYDASTGTGVGAARQRSGDTWGRTAVGLYGGYEHVIGRFSAIVQLGYNVANGAKDQRLPHFYQRYGWRYHFSDRYWGTLAVRAIEGRKADFLEFGVGYRTRWR